MKKLVSTMMAVLMAATLVAGCGSKEETAEAPAAEAEETEAPAEEADGSVTTVTEGVLTMGTNAAFPPYEFYEGDKIERPPQELEVLYFLASHPGMVFTREQLLEQVWGYDYFGDSRTVDVHVKRLREKLTEGEKLGWQIKTVWGVGYKFEVK